MKGIISVLIIYTIVVASIGVFMYQEGYYKGMEELCQNGELGVDLHTEEYKCYDKGEIKEIALKNSPLIPIIPKGGLMFYGNQT